MNAVLTKLHFMLGDRAVFMPLPLGEKKLVRPNWQSITFEQTQEPDYQEELDAAIERGGNIAVRLTDGLVSLDVDDDAAVELFTAKGEIFSETLRSRGKRGCNFWYRIKGSYPNGQNVYKLRVKGLEIGEWRCGPGAYTLIYGDHPDGSPDNPIRYQRIVARPAKELTFEEFQWPEGVILPWSQKNGSSHESSRETSADLDKRISAYMAKVAPSIAGSGGDDQLFDAARVLVIDWGLSQDEALPYLRAFNDRCEPPWKEDRLLHKLKEADEKGRGERGRLRGENSRVSVSSENPESRPKVTAYYDVARKEYLIQNAAGRWHSYDQGQFKLQLRSRGYPTGKPQDSLVSPAELVMLNIQNHFDVGYAGPLAGRKAGFYEENGARMLVTSSPEIMTHDAVRWTLLEKILRNALAGLRSLGQLSNGLSLMPG